MKNFEPLILNSNDDREPFSPGATEAGFNTTRSNIKTIDSSFKITKPIGNPPPAGFNTTRSNIKN